MLRHSDKKFFLLTLILAACTVLTIIVSTGMGYMAIGPEGILRVIGAHLLGNEALVDGLEKTVPYVVMDVRLPRILTAALVGAGRLKARKLRRQAEMFQNPRRHRAALDDGDDPTGASTDTIEELVSKNAAHERLIINAPTSLDDATRLRRGQNDERAPVGIAGARDTHCVSARKCSPRGTG